MTNNETKVYTKQTEGGLWEKHTRLAMGLSFFTGAVLFLLFGLGIEMILPSSLKNIPGFSIVETMIELITYFIAITAFGCVMIQRHFRPSLMGFVKEDGKLYAIALGDTIEDLGTDDDASYIYAPSGSIAQAAVLPHNIKVAKNELAHEKEVREYSKQENVYIESLHDILTHLKKYPDDYMVIPDSKKLKIDLLMKCRVENGAFSNVITDKRAYGFLILNNPKIVKETAKYFDVQFLNENGEVCTARFSKCFKEAFETKA